MSGIAIAFMIIAFSVWSGILGYCMYVQISGGKKRSDPKK
jgi:hypothetical protein